MSAGPALGDVVAADPGAWLRRAGTWDGLSRALSDRATELERSAPGAWAGADADAAARSRAEQVRRLRDDAGTATRAAHVLGAHAGEVLDAQRRLVVAALAVHPQFSVDLERGTLSAGAGALPLGMWRLPATVARFAADLVRLSGAVADAVGAAPRSDRATAAALDALRPAPGPAPLPVTPAAEPPAGAGPGTVRAWWTGLAAAERERLLRTRPALVGGRDGVPVPDRDRANRILLEDELSRLRARVALLERAGDTVGADRAGRTAAGLEATRRRLDAGGASLLRLERGTTGGRIVLAVGDPERATHVLTHVPGTTAGWDTVPGDLARVEATRAAARAVAPGGSVAAVLWTGYDAPPDLLAAADPGAARAAAGDLRDFQDGLRTGHDGPVHLTVVGHSYGSVVAGNAARGAGLAADDVVFVGSPGTGAAHASDLGTAPGHVWATTAGHDPIGRVPGVEVFATSRGLSPTGLLHGPDPAAPGFGARVFASAPGSPLPRPDDPATPNDETAFASAHGGYWDPGSPSLSTLGRIVAGAPVPP
ncbi:alpha/beta hydrolase [Pseudonocardia sp. ICBG1293]|uniref:alpha/beta hydrolase n=1 Tax=Pseudonocardia sp. ICBG1293 TaxID=2844382 RepID=UPI001CCAB34A|nr:alpha/beta hydrolase [Pseudonocardia sp. ICBG1293]